jgi:ABC-2 type transport system permease protein
VNASAFQLGTALKEVADNGGPLKKYWIATRSAIQTALVYRANFFVKAFFSIVPLIAIVKMWQSIYQQKNVVAGYTFAQMASYYLAVCIVEHCTAVSDEDWKAAEEIKDGRISQFLLKPIDYLYYRLSVFVAGRAVSFISSIFAIAAFAAIFCSTLNLATDGLHLLIFGASVILSALIRFFLAFIIACLSFWATETSSFVFVLLAFERLAGGQLLPIHMLPETAQAVLYCTPFPYGLYFTASILIEAAPAAHLAWGIAAQLFWVCLLFGAARYIWRRGLKSYTATGA